MSDTSGQLSEKLALITGASRGLGAQMAEALAAAGAALALVGRDAPALESIRDRIVGGGGRAEVFLADVSDDRGVATLHDEVLRRLGAPDIVINSAGINVRKPISELTTDDWNRVLATNLSGPFFCARAFAHGMIERQWGRIINMTSMMSHVSLPGRAAYSASKAGLLGLIRALALEFAPHNITVNGISPGPFATEMNTVLMQDAAMNAEFVSRIPLGRWGRVEEIGALAVFLCSDAAGFITGTDIRIDGGWTAR